jgi:DUF4097 and DUF4098 domain-containing protein YvlB
LTPTGGGLSLDASSPRGRFPFGDSGSVDYVVEVPANIGVLAQASSGRISIDGVSGPVQANASSGQVELVNVSGEVRANTTSGRITGTGLQHVRQVQSSSGSINLSGVFTEAAQIVSSSGSVQLTLMPGSAVQLDVHSQSGSVQPQNLRLSGPGAITTRSQASGAIGAPADGATLSVRTSSGSVSVTGP